MTDKDYAPLSAHCVRALCDKMYEKRKAAALEIEKLTKDCIQINNQTQVQKLLRVLGTDFAMSQNPNMRKGGLIGLAAMAIGMGPESASYVSELVKPVLNCMDDTDSRVRFYACESLYNVTKVARDAVLPLFNDCFVAMAKVVTDLDQSVRTAAELLDRLLKDIITENLTFSTENFIPILKQCMYTQHPFGRSFCIGWVHTMHKVPNPIILKYLPDLLDPMFLFLTDEKHEIYVRCQRELLVFLDLIEKNPPQSEEFVKMVNNLVVHVQSTNIRMQTMSVHWLRAFVGIPGTSLFPYISGILAAILPNLSYETGEASRKDHLEYKRIGVMSKKLYMDLMKIFSDRAPKLRDSENSAEDLKNLEYILLVLDTQLQAGKTESKVGALKWINLMFTIVEEEMSVHIDRIFPTLLKTLSDSNDEVVILALRVLSVICKPSPGEKKHFSLFMRSLYMMFKTDKNLLKEKGGYLIRQLSIFIGPENIYKSMSEEIGNEEDIKFATLLVEHLNAIMFTSAELSSLREQIKLLNTPESKNLFISLYKTWAHSEPALLALVFLSGCYSHALTIIKEISKYEITVDFLLEVDRFVQIIESPIFSFLRYELLDSEQNGDLILALYGLLNLIPQTTAFKTLNDRMKTLPREPLLKPSTQNSPKKLKKHGIGNKAPKDIDFNELLASFSENQAKHQRNRVRAVSKDMVTSQDAIKLFEVMLNDCETVEFPIVDEEDPST